MTLNSVGCASAGTHNKQAIKRIAVNIFMCLVPEGRNPSRSEGLPISEFGFRISDLRSQSLIEYLEGLFHRSLRNHYLSAAPELSIGTSASQIQIRNPKSKMRQLSLRVGFPPVVANQRHGTPSTTLSIAATFSPPLSFLVLDAHCFHKDVLQVLNKISNEPGKVL